MNKVDLIAAMSAETGMTKKATAPYVDAIINCITTALANGEKVQLQGFGTFDVVESAERDGRNPLTGEAIHIKSKLRPKFKASSVLKAAINE